MADDRRPGSINFVAPYKGGMISGWPTGMDNRSSDADVPRSSLRDIVNFDVLNSGKLRTRKGMRQVIADSGAHSVYAFGGFLVWATATTLNIATTNLVKTVLATNALYAKPISYVVVNNELYFSNEDINGKVTSAGGLVPWGVTPPTAAPYATSSGGNRMVQITCTFVTSTGEESGAPLGFMVSCADTFYVQVSQIPQSGDARVTHTRIYVSDIGGDMFYQAYDVPAGTTTLTLNGEPSKGQPLRTQFMEPPPPGQLVTAENGVIYIASGSNVFHTEPLYYGCCDYVEGVFMYPERVTLCRAVDAGLFVSADKTYFLPKAGTDEVGQTTALPYRAYEGAVCDSLDSLDVFWMSERGMIKGSQSGEMVNLIEQQLAVDVHTRGCVGIIESNGHKALVAVMRERVRNSPLAASDYLVARDG